MALRRQIIGFLFLFLLTPFAALAQGEEELKKSAEELFATEQYEEAFAQYSQLLALKLQSPEYNFRFGACQLFTSSDKELALKYLKYAVESENPPNLANFYYGLGLHLNYRFEKALKYYERYKTNGPKKDREGELVDHYIQQCNNGIELVSNFTDISVINRETLPRTEFYRNYDLSEFGGKIMVKPEDFMSDEDKERDAKFLMYFQQQADYIYYGSYSKKNETGKDLYVIQKLPTGDWSQPKRLSDVINTPFDEDYPFIHPDGNVLYFASKGHNSMGGYDIFKSTRRGDGTWTNPINMEFAINTPWDDFMFISDKDEKMAWFSSNRETGSTDVSVYRIGIERVPLDLTLIKGTFEAEGSKKAKITVEDVVQNKTVGVFESERQFGGYLLDIKGSGKYKFIVEAEESNAIHTGLVEIPREKGLKQFRQEMTLVNTDGKEQLQIINHFDEPLEESLLTAEILRKQASLSINSTEDDLRSTEILDDPSDANDEDSSGESIDDVIAATELQQQTLENDAAILNEKASLLYTEANAKSSSTDPSEVAQAALAAELAGEYKKEADLRNTAANSMLQSIEEAKSASEDVARAKLNQSKATSDNFKPLDTYEEKLAESFVARSVPIEELYNQKLDERNEIASDIEGIDEEISYYNSEIENTKDEAIVEELKLQRQEAAAAKPEKQAALDRAISELDVAETALDNAKNYSGIVSTLIGGTAEASSNVANGTISAATDASSINALQSTLSAKSGSNPALIAFISPELVKSASEESLAEARKQNGEDESVDSDGSGTNNSPTESDNEPDKETLDSDNIASNEVESDIDSNNGQTGDAPISEGSNGQANIDATESSDLNEDIRVIEAVESSPEIVSGDYNMKLQSAVESIDEEDPIIAESKKAEIYDQWVDNIQYRIDSLTDVKSETIDSNEQLALTNEIEGLEEAKSTKNELALSAYENIAVLTDEQAADANLISNEEDLAVNNSPDNDQNSGGNDPSNSELENTGVEIADQNIEELNSEGDEQLNTESPTESSSESNPGSVESIGTINTKFETQIADLKAPSDEDNIKEEIAINKAWAGALQQELIVLGEKISNAETNAEKYELEDLAAEISTLRQEKETRAAKLQLEMNEALANEEYTNNNAELQKDLNALVENYNSTSFIDLERSIENIADTTERSAKQEMLYKNWLMGLKNEEYKTETRIANTDDQNQIADLDEKLIKINAEKLYVQSALGDIAANASEGLNAPEAPAAVVVKGAERFEGYESVATDKPIEYDQKTQASYTEITDQQSDIAELETDLANAKKKEKPAVEIELEKAKNALAILELESNFYAEAQPKIEVVEQILLQKEANEQLASEKQILEAEVITKEAVKLEEIAAEKRAEANAVKKKKDKPAAEKEARDAEHLAAMKRREADLAMSLGEEMIEIEKRAIAQNFIIPAGEAAPLPIVTSTLNPTEQADVEQTEQFGTYNEQIREVDSIQNLARKLAQLERTYTEQAQAILEGNLTANPEENTSAATPARRTQEAFVLYEKADSVSAAAAKLNRQAAFIENKANIALLKNPEEVYTPILAYYNSKPEIDTTQAELADNAIIETGEITENETGDEATAPDSTEADSVDSAEIVEELANEFSETDSSLDVEETNIPPIETVPAETESTSETTESTGSEQDQFDLTPPEENEVPIEVQEDVLTNTIFEIDDVPTNAYYSETTPIPVDPELPSGILFKVQIGAFRNQIQQDAFKGIKPITGESAGNGLTRYTAGAFSKFAEADFAKDEIRGIGYNDAFVVAYRDGKRISVDAAQNAIASGEPVAYTRPQGRNDRPVATPTPSGNNAGNSIGNAADNSPSGLVKRGALEIESVENLPGVFYTVQVGVYSKPVTSEDIFGITPLNQENLPNGNYRYSNGVYREFNKADLAKEEIRNIGVTDAFVTAYNSGTRITVGDAQTQIEGGANSEITDAPVTENSGTYRVKLGTFEGQVPIDQAKIILSLSANGVDKIDNGDGTSTYYYGEYEDEASASARAAELASSGLNQAKAVQK